MTNERHVLTISAGLSQPSSTSLLTTRLAEATTRELAELGQHASVRQVELRTYAHAIVDAMLTGFPTGDLATVLGDVGAADGIVLATPLFATTYSGLFKSFVDLIDPQALTGTPVLLGATGGTPRHSLALEYSMRPLFTYLHADVMTTSVFAATDDWARESDGAGLPERITRAGREFARRIATHTSRGPVDPFASTPSFEDLLSDR